MSLLRTVATLRAAALGRAERLTTVRHQQLADPPFVFIPLALAGEACAPLAAMAGTDAGHPVLLTVEQPRDRTRRFRFAEQLADLLLPYVDECRGDSETYEAGRPKESRERFTRAPQILVPNQGGIAFTRLLGRSTRLRRTDGPYAVAPSVPTLGKWLTWAADQADFPGSSTLLSMTRMLGDHWATGQSSTEDAHLAALLAWIDPPPGMTGAQAARLAEDPARHPPAGPATDPLFDRTLSELVTAYGTAAGDRARAATGRAIEAELRTQLAPTWDLMWRGIELLRALPPGGHVEERWALDRALFTGYASHLDESGLPQPRRDHAAGAARRLARLEDAVARYESQRAFDDPLVMAEYELSGEAFTGTVTAREPDRVIESGGGGGRGGKAGLFRPLVTLRTEQRPPIGEGETVLSPDRPGQKAEILTIRDLGGSDSSDSDGGAGNGFEADIQLSGGFGGKRKPPAPPGSIPEIGEQLCYTTLGQYVASAQLPDDADTPWTHGGPPQPYEPTHEDAEETWE
ncbi:hypothetical protein LHJ74_19965 [Streptomyces sp. N2-109]|uniref:Uncharacterized protein n=1 Tax=Streptomyces gossypii TaxID=2883101 RepID=A0ABT2JW66_9ACTN|nr:hypothetical protein [Streptomyces gossypii]MCT2592152.1 hypothetical protein [Streptomyces gossypii]